MPTTKPKPGVKRITATVDEATAEEVKRLASAIGMSTTRMLGLLIGIAVRSSGATIEQFGEQFGVFMPPGADE